MYWKQCRHFWLDIRDNVRKISNTKKTFSLFLKLQQSQLPCWWLKKSVTEFLSLMWFKWFFFLTSQYKYNAEQHAIWSDLRGKSSKVCYTRIFYPQCSFLSNQWLFHGKKENISPQKQCNSLDYFYMCL